MKLIEIAMLSVNLDYDHEPETLQLATKHLIDNQHLIAHAGAFDFCSANGYLFLKKTSSDQVCGMAKIDNNVLDVIYWLPEFRNGKSLPTFIHLLQRYLKGPLEIKADSAIFKHGQHLLQAILDRQPQFKVVRVGADGSHHKISKIDEIGNADSLLIEDAPLNPVQSRLPGVETAPHYIDYFEDLS